MSSLNIKLPPLLQTSANPASRPDAGRKGNVHVNDVPQELLAEIASHIFPDTESLKALSVVSHAWRAPAQRYAFARLSVRGDVEGTPTGRSTADLQALLARAPHLAGYVTHLTVEERRGQDDMDSRREWDRMLCAVLPLFQSLTRFTLVWGSHSRWAWAHSAYATPILPELLDIIKTMLRLPQLTHVEFTGAPLSWVQFVTPKVKSLALWSPFIDLRTEGESAPADVAANDEEGAEDTSKHGNNTASLPFSHVRPTALLIDGLDWASCYEIGEASKQILQAGLDVSRLRKLGLGLISSPPSSHSDVAKLLQACAGTLEELSLTPAFGSYSPARDDYTDSINLAVLTRLRVLHISAQAGIVYNEVDIEPMLWLLAQLKRMPPSNRLRTLILSAKYTVYETVHNNGYFGISFESYGELQALLLTKTRFPKFKMFVNYTEDPEAEPKMKLLIWIAMSITQYTRAFAERKAFAFKFGGLYRPKIFPPHTPW